MEGKTILIILAIFLVWNLVTFFVMGIDKRKAKNGSRRISESTLLLLAFAMGSVGVLAGMLVWHHKTKTIKFLVCVPIAILVDALAIYGFSQFLF